MKVQTKNKPAIHLTKRDTLVLTNPTSGKQSAFRVFSVQIDEEFYQPVRVIVQTPELDDKKATAVIPYAWRDNVEVEL